MNRKSILFLIAVALFCMIPGCGEESHVKILKLAHVLDTSHPVYKALVFMVAKVEEKSQGKMRVDIYPGGQLGGERDLIELLKT